MTSIAKLFALVMISGTLAAGASVVAAETPDSTVTSAGESQETVHPSVSSHEMSPVERVRENKSWNYGPFINYGNGVGDRSDYKFLSGGFQLGKPLTPVVHAGIFSGQFELGGNIMPLWQAYTPAPSKQSFTCSSPEGPYACSLSVGGGTFRGVSITPVIFRWNFLTRSMRFQPWFQGAGGLIYTTHKFPPSIQSTQTVNGQTVLLDGGTCVWNFTPQGGVGAHYFIHPKRSIDLGVNAVHISSASLGDRNPGVNASIQIQVGYTFWK